MGLFAIDLDQSHKPIILDGLEKKYATFNKIRPQQYLLKIGFEPNKSGRFGKNWTFMRCRICINL